MLKHPDISLDDPTFQFLLKQKNYHEHTFSPGKIQMGRLYVEYAFAHRSYLTYLFCYAKCHKSMEAW
jgi:hypothetical protein